MATTGPVITSAATVMLFVFAAFTLGDFLLTKLLGFALAVAVLLDATVVRMVVGPALLQLAGRYNWWPGDRRASPAPSVAGPVPLESGQVGQVLGSTGGTFVGDHVGSAEEWKGTSPH
jgi:RND superfamily putative drug exporter